MASLSGITSFYKVPELRRRVLFTLVMLAVYRVGVFVTVPGVDRTAMKQFVKTQGGVVGFFNMFTGGALEQLSIFALGIMPYISASIILQLMGMVYKPVEELRKEGEQGRRKLDQYTRYGTVALSMFQAFTIATWLEGSTTGDVGAGIVNHPGFGFRLMTMVTLTTGTAFLMWIGEQITERGISNGISLLIFAGIIADIPSSIFQYFASNAGNIQPLTIAVIVAFVILIIGTVAFFENGRRQIPIVYSRRQVGRRVYGGQTAHLPLKVNTAGTIPPIFASSLLMFPATLANMNVPGADKLQAIINRGDWVFNTGYALLIVFFCFFYTNVTFQPVDVAENLKKQQANIPGVRPGKQTADYIHRVIQRITFGGAMYVAAVCVLPAIFGSMMRIQFSFGGTSLMIVVGVALDAVNQIEAHMLTRSYEGLTGPGAGRIRGRQVQDV
ncbi:preprotein translocase subunit SecY [Chondromyces crocatus]|uniref:Protein translocase subunit SecY n=1 Tax=Chondromyces crocatus TaxID=52 RepID=A0A0K1E7V2_CHOCO|nr:preprotein translocase subunit SecY [Chondromyces crocatus]AKT36638.1 preprotein translocase subunit SecY [Chondromyces crocatus]